MHDPGTTVMMLPIQMLLPHETLPQHDLAMKPSDTMLPPREEPPMLFLPLQERELNAVTIDLSTVSYLQTLIGLQELT